MRGDYLCYKSIILIDLADLATGVIDPELLSLIDRHGADGCRLYLEQLRWPLGIGCPRCRSADALWLERRRHHCRVCRYQFRVTARTVFHDSHLSLPKWFLAVSLMLSETEGISASRLRAILGGSYKSAWFLEHRIRSAMAARTAEPSGLVAYSSAVPAHEHPNFAPSAARESVVQAPHGWPLLRSLIAGVHQNVSVRYLSAYWDEARWRNANRANPDAFRETVLALLGASWLPYQRLTGSGELPGAAEDSA